jgi:hypothetical protein
VGVESTALARLLPQVEIGKRGRADVSAGHLSSRGDQARRAHGWCEDSMSRHPQRAGATLRDADMGYADARLAAPHGSCAAAITCTTARELVGALRAERGGLTFGSRRVVADSGSKSARAPRMKLIRREIHTQHTRRSHMDTRRHRHARACLRLRRSRFAAARW